MVLYRALRDLDKPGRTIQKGEVFLDDGFSQEALDRLEQLGKIARVNTPPLRVLLGWQIRARKLNKFGIQTVEEFLATPDLDVANAIRVSEEQITRWKQSILESLRSPKPKG